MLLLGSVGDADADADIAERRQPQRQQPTNFNSPHSLRITVTRTSETAHIIFHTFILAPIIII